MIQVYLPIAEMSVDAVILMALGAIVGVLSGMFGVGGGFLMTPALLFLGVPPAIAVGTQANQLIGASVSGVLGHWQRRTVDFQLGWVMTAGGAIGATFGVALFAHLDRSGQLEAVVTVGYVLLLSAVGVLMLVESAMALGSGERRARVAEPPRWTRRLPWQLLFPASGITLSLLLPLLAGALGGILVAVFGIGGGFVLVPLMIYALGMPVRLVAGTSLFQIIFTTLLSTILQALTNRSVDMVLAALLLVGAAIGAQIGSRIGSRMRPEYSRLLMAMLLLSVAGRLFWSLRSVPTDPFSVIP